MENNMQSLLEHINENIADLIDPNELIYITTEDEHLIDGTLEEAILGALAGAAVGGSTGSIVGSVTGATSGLIAVRKLNSYKVYKSAQLNLKTFKSRPHKRRDANFVKRVEELKLKVLDAKKRFQTERLALIKKMSNQSKNAGRAAGAVAGGTVGALATPV